MAPGDSGHRELDRYLLDGERLVTAVHQHWGKVAEPVGSALAGAALALWVDATIDDSLGLVSTLLWWVWFALLARAVYRVAEWRHDWFVATDKRLLLFYGFITRKVSMMPLSKVTDMSYSRSVPGRLLGYGAFTMESAGQDQALRVVNWVPEPDAHYRAICAEIFGVAAEGRLAPVDDEGYAALPPPYAGWDDARHGDHTGDGEYGDGADRSRAIPVRARDESLYRSPDLRRPDRDADTGPIPVRPPADPYGR